MEKKSEQLCEKCKHFLDGKCRKGIPHLLGDVISCETFEVTTNGDAIRAMSDKQLAIFLGDVDCCNPNHCEPGMYCGKCWLEWLKAPVEDAK